MPYRTNHTTYAPEVHPLRANRVALGDSTTFVVLLQEQLVHVAVAHAAGSSRPLTAVEQVSLQEQALPEALAGQQQQQLSETAKLKADMAVLSAALRNTQSAADSLKRQLAAEQVLDKQYESQILAIESGAIAERQQHESAMS